jgi:D-glycero-alpha-D-manno-heptose-7-phosphate kinase
VIVRGKAPLRVSFAGGGTDVPPFPQLEGGAVLSATIDRYAYGSLRPRSDGQVCIESVDFGRKVDFHLADELVLDGQLDLVKAAIKRIGNGAREGYDLVLRTNAPPGSGLGSSSTMMVALVALLQNHYNLPLSEYELAELAWHIERVDLGIEGGVQDHYAATFGGFNFIEIGERVIVNPLRVPADVVNELEMNLLLCYTGVSRESTKVIEDQTSRVVAANAETMAGLRAQKVLAVDMKSALLRGQLDQFGDLLCQAWEEKKRMSPMISTPRIEEVFAEARKHGARGGKVTGAGGGGHILFYCDFTCRHNVIAALERMGCVLSEFSFAPNGVATWRA